MICLINKFGLIFIFLARYPVSSKTSLNKASLIFDTMDMSQCSFFIFALMGSAVVGDLIPFESLIDDSSSMPIFECPVEKLMVRRLYEWYTLLEYASFFEAHFCCYFVDCFSA